MSTSSWQKSVVPAQLSFLAIYNPTLGLTDETFKDQVVFYYSRAAHEARVAAKKSNRRDAAGGDVSRSEENEKLRQIGLAQGMVDFARSFSDGKPVDSIDTEKSRIVLHELEKGWWILASIDLTQLPSITQPSADMSRNPGGKSAPTITIEYSAREVSPPALLIQQLIQAHHIFTLHHGASLTELYIRVSRESCCLILDRFWSRFARTWDVLLHGSPVTDIFGGIKLSGGGELGMGVGEEEWGSGERDVLEDLARRTEGLVDLVVSRFGEPAPAAANGNLRETEALPWMGCGDYPLASDGVIFGGINGITKPSLRNVSLWMRQIYTFGDYAYGIRDNPLRERRRRRRRKPPLPDPEPDLQRAVPKVPSTTETWDFHSEQPSEQQKADSSPVEDASADATGYPSIPPSIVTAAEASLRNATQSADRDMARLKKAGNDEPGSTLGIPDQYMKYLTFGLSTLAKPQSRPVASRKASANTTKTVASESKIGSTRHSTQADVDETEEDDDTTIAQVDPQPDGDQLRHKIAIQKRLEEKGHFVVGLKGDLDQLPDDDNADAFDLEDEGAGGLRNVLRTVHVHLAQSHSENEDDAGDSRSKKLRDAVMPTDGDNSERLRVLVFAHRPFLYCFLFKNRTPALTLARFYKELHNNLTPIHKPLLASTSVLKITQRIEEAQASVSDAASITSAGSRSAKAAEQPSPIYDLLYDPALLTVHTSIPNIAQPGTPAAEGIISGREDAGLPGWRAWTRIEALNVHSQILNTLAGVQKAPHVYERTSKTSRGWWVVYMKLPPTTKQDTEADTPAAAQGNPENTMSNVAVSEPGETLESMTSLDIVRSDDTILDSTKHSSFASTELPPAPMNRIAFLVRKASDSEAPVKASSTSRAASSMWNALTLRPASMSDQNTGGAGAGWAPAALTGGIGFDARKYVEGLLSLNR